jgi:hypothetical protein
MTNKKNADLLAQNLRDNLKRRKQNAAPKPSAKKENAIQKNQKTT